MSAIIRHPRRVVPTHTRSLLFLPYQSIYELILAPCKVALISLTFFIKGSTACASLPTSASCHPRGRTCRQTALQALGAWPGGLQLGGGVTADNAASWLDAGASHVIVTSYVFRDGALDEDRLRDLVRAMCQTNGRGSTFMQRLEQEQQQQEQEQQEQQQE